MAHPGISLEGLRERRKTSIGISGASTEILTEYPSKTRQPLQD